MSLVNVRNLSYLIIDSALKHRSGFKNVCWVGVRSAKMSRQVVVPSGYLYRRKILRHHWCL